MAICASCGAASADGALRCASCGRPLAPPRPTAAPATGASAIGPVTAEPPLAAPPLAPPRVGSWGSGTAYDPAAGQPAALRWLTGSDWRPALRAVIAPTGVLLLAALLAAVPTSYGGAFPASFGSRFGAALAAALAALGAPFKVHMSAVIDPRGVELSFDYLLRVLPMTVLVLWLLALWLGLRRGLRTWQARTGGQVTRQQAFGEAVRTALVATVVTLLLGLLCGGRWQPPHDTHDTSDFSGGFFSGFDMGADAGWPQALAWTVLLAGLPALAVYGTDALRWAAWRNAGVRGWAVAGLTAGRALTAVLGLASLAAFLVVAAQGEGSATLASLAFLPNLGLLLLGFGSGSTFVIDSARDRGASDQGGTDLAAMDLSNHQVYSFFGLKDVTGDWRWAGLLALAAVLVLGWTAFRRRLDAADRIRLALVYGVSLTLLTLLAGGTLTSTTPGVPGFDSPALSGGSSSHTSVGLTLATVLAANLLWAAAGALGLPVLLAVLGVGVPANAAVDPPAETAAVPPQGGYATDLAAPAADGTAAPGVVVPGVVVPVAADLLDSHDRTAPAGPPTAAGGGPTGDSSVWRRQDPADG